MTAPELPQGLIAEGRCTPVIVVPAAGASGVPPKIPRLRDDRLLPAGDPGRGGTVIKISVGGVEISMLPAGGPHPWPIVRQRR
ncbi:hypothetical protein [Methylobacterium sp. ID0610]|uniref:hypothetical protein n=1 Tax=Methylobacterium carpenticola TaxID=3344827 RepID=UPI0036C3AB54